MKKIIGTAIFVYLFLLTAGNTIAQQSDEYLLELKSGVTVKCFLVSISDNTIYAISEEGRKLNVNMTDVKSFEKIYTLPNKNTEEFFKERESRRNHPREDYEREQRDETDLNERSHIHSGLKHHTISVTLKGGTLVQFDDRDESGGSPVFSGTGIVSYEMGHFSAGLGITVDGISTMQDFNNTVFIPVFADLKYNFRHYLGVTPFIFGDAGFSLTERSGNGLMLSGGIGFKKRISKKLDLIVDAGFKYQQTKHENIVFAVDGDPIEPGFPENNFRRSGSVNYLTFNVGLQF
ncbi:hypothetical protein BH10BAC5_BH10BAC5_10510 [soil metagenome]